MLSTLLNELDGIEDRAGIFVVSACTDLKVLDSALIRPGRFDLLLEVPLPKTVRERCEILRTALYPLPLPLPDQAFNQHLAQRVRKPFHRLLWCQFLSFRNNVLIHCV